MSRDQMIADAIKHGFSRADASVLTDVSKHAFDEEIATTKRIVETAPRRLQAPTFVSVLASFATLMREHFPEHWSAFVASTLKDSEYGCVIVLPDKRQNGEVG